MNLRTGTFALGSPPCGYEPPFRLMAWSIVVRRGVRFGQEPDAEGLLGVVSRDCRVFTWQK